MRLRVSAASSSSNCRLLSCALSIAILLVTATHARADDDDDSDRLSPSTATALSAGFTVGGTAAFIAGLSAPKSDLAGAAVLGGGSLMLLGPSTGHWYARDFRPTIGGALRAGGASIAMMAVIMNGTVCAVGAILDDDPTRDHDCSVTKSPAAMTVLVVGAAMYIGGAAYDISTARRSVLRENAKRAAARRASSWAVTPVVSPTSAGVSVLAAF